MTLKEAVEVLDAAVKAIAEALPPSDAARLRIARGVLVNLPLDVVGALTDAGGLAHAERHGRLYVAFCEARDPEERMDLAIALACRAVADHTSALTLEREAVKRLTQQVAELTASLELQKKRMALASEVVTELMRNS